LLRRPWLLDAGIRAAADQQSAFDDLVRLSLADGTISLRLAAEVGRRLAVVPREVGDTPGLGLTG